MVLDKCSQKPGYGFGDEDVFFAHKISGILKGENAETLVIALSTRFGQEHEACTSFAYP